MVMVKLKTVHVTSLTINQFEMSSNCWEC